MCIYASAQPETERGFHRGGQLCLHAAHICTSVTEKIAGLRTANNVLYYSIAHVQRTILSIVACVMVNFVLLLTSTRRILLERCQCMQMQPKLTSACGMVECIDGQTSPAGTSPLWHDTARHGQLAVPCCVVPPCRKGGPGTALPRLSRAVLCP